MRHPKEPRVPLRRERTKARRARGDEMTPEDASELLRHAEDRPRRCRRYVLEGGKRCQWQCQRCGWKTEAETGREAHKKLMGCPVLCAHGSIDRLAHLPMPPADFS